jgi:uncharacterized membrane protein (DUF373 family)
MEAELGRNARVQDRWPRIIKGFERLVVLALIALLMIIVAILAVELVWLLVRDLRSARAALLDVEETLALFGSFMLILIGIELLTILKSHILEGVVHVEVVLEVALMALTQKLIILDTSRTNPMLLLGLAALILVLALGFRLIVVRRPREMASDGG